MTSVTSHSWRPTSGRACGSWRVFGMLAAHLGALAVGGVARDVVVADVGVQAPELLAAHHVDEVQPLAVDVLQLGELLAEDHRGRRAVAVDQREGRLRLGQQRRLDDRQHRRDAAAGGEAEVALAVLGRQRQVEVPHRRHHLDADTGLQGVVGPGREAAAGGALDGHAQVAVLHRRADRIRAPDILPVAIAPQRQVLALCIGEALAPGRRHGEGGDDGVARLLPHLGNGQRIELAHVSGT